MKRIVTVTMNPSIDIGLKAAKIQAEKKLRCSKPRFAPGGGGINISRVVKRLGGESLAVLTEGGAAGKMLHDLLEKESLNLHPIEISEMTRENFNVVEESTNQQFRFIMPGPELKKEEWEECLSTLKSLDPPPDYIAASGSLPPGAPEDFYAKVAELADTRNTHFILDASGNALKRAAEHGVFMLLPNINELKQMLDKEPEDEKALIRASRDIVEKGWAEVLVVSLGAGGAILTTMDGSEHLRAPTVPIKSRVGAGDSMAAGIVTSLAQGNNIRESVRYGIAAGSAAVMSPGSELCRKEDFDRIYSGMK